MVPQTQTRMAEVRKIRKMTDEELAAEKKKKLVARATEKKAQEATAEIPPATSHLVPFSYQVQIEFADEDEDGKKVQKIKMETRTATTQVMRGKTKTESVENKKVYELDALKVLDVNGKVLEVGVIKKRLDDQSPVILIPSNDCVGPYFAELFNQNVLFIVVPRK